jgi:hypothetical protein
VARRAHACRRRVWSRHRPLGLVRPARARGQRRLVRRRAGPPQGGADVSHARPAAARGPVGALAGRGGRAGAAALPGGCCVRARGLGRGGARQGALRRRGRPRGAAPLLPLRARAAHVCGVCARLAICQGPGAGALLYQGKRERERADTAPRPPTRPPPPPPTPDSGATTR